MHTSIFLTVFSLALAPIKVQANAFDNVKSDVEQGVSQVKGGINTAVSDAKSQSWYANAKSRADHVGDSSLKSKLEHNTHSGNRFKSFADGVKSTLDSDYSHVTSRAHSRVLNFGKDHSKSSSSGSSSNSGSSSKAGADAYVAPVGALVGAVAVALL
ncbi:hypothetical protein HYPBUDRAFT_166611 [Hyphopichia burtonii NRRL Y-1933]|uniref:Uncharacterized protein n=1 Tax=Hyphopichia burtonii NRRL Y-1933 TaxID=984485 RepID=A0A1E4RLQ8_9ASCO|nr:hypothetical protein HYPBUDRAFT_166611 [Hyphopichia burtonii NRRL Y-1933]ODV68200.1 hypothetical protein HYPBUDRAFT_166611 [Hyphopichia burtonii NRRL Y-1933]